MSTINRHFSESLSRSGIILALVTSLFLGICSPHIATANNQRNWLPAINQLLLDKEPEPAICEQAGVSIINFGRADLSGNPTCFSSNQSASVQCMRQRLRSVLRSGCTSNIDIFTPGTNQENGNWVQFRELVEDDDNRSAISINYEDGAGDHLRYDDSVIHGHQAVSNVVQAIKEEFPSVKNVRIYGHSKGSHIVSLAAEDVLDKEGFEPFYFYAFGQPRRTAERISLSFSPRGRLGPAGFITKLSNNLSGITWQNDEVYDYKGIGTSGLAIPPSWLHAGRIKDTGTGLPATPVFSRIDHHETYGGNPSKQDSLPYCATGRWSLLNLDSDFAGECSKVDEFIPAYFWSKKECREHAWDQLEDIDNDGNFANNLYIGNSGPRAENDCTEQSVVFRNVFYELKYRYNRADQQCKFNIRVSFEGLGGRVNGSFFSDSASDGNTFQVQNKSGNVNVPLHMNLKIETWLSEQNTNNPVPFLPDFVCQKSVAQTESYIDSLTVTIPRDVGEDEPVLTKVTLIGNRETSHYPIGSVTNRDLSGWFKSNGEWNLEYDTILTNLKIEGVTNKNANGTFTKIIHLND